MATSDAGGAASRLAWRAVRAAKALVLAVGVYGCILQLPCAAAAACAVLRVAASLSVQQYLFLVSNAIGLFLYAHFRGDDEAASFSPVAAFNRWWPSEESEADAQGRFLAFPGAQLVPPPPPTTEAGEEEKEVFEDKKAVHVTTVRAKPPRRSRSEKVGGGASGRMQAAAPELRRGESENGRQRQRAVAEAEAEQEHEWAMADPEAFRLWIDAFILKQNDFQRKESAASGSGEKGAPVAAGAVVAVK